MRMLAMILLLSMVAACRGEPVPRDRQNMPSTATSPVDVNPGMVEPEPSYGAQGTSAPYETTTLADPPASSENPGIGTELPADAITTTRGTTRPAEPSPTP